MKYNILYNYKMYNTLDYYVTLIERGITMGQIVCSVCNSTVDYFEDEKVTVLYGQCSSSDCEHHHHHDYEE